MPERESFRSGHGPDPLAIYDHLETYGISTTLLDPNERPWNPLAGHSTLVQSLDPSRALRVLFRERQFDLVVSVFEGSAAPLLAARRLFGYRPKIALWDIGLTEQWPLRERVLDFVVPRVDSIMVLGSNQKSYIERRWHPRATIEVIYHHIDTQFFFSPVAAHAPTKGPILSVGDDVGRDFETLAAALDGSLVETIVKTRRQFPQHSSLGRGVKVISKWLSYLELRDLYANSLFVVIPVLDTLNASGVSSILEASAMGKALIVSDSSGIRDYVVPGETCLVVPCGDARALRAAIEKLCLDEAECIRLGVNGRRFTEERFSKQRFADRLAGTLRRIVAQ
jgi:glycosyltransferase involved in cell wall biosynthesis